jgi:hypothetical protein
MFGDVHVTVYPAMKIIFFDYSREDEFHKSFFVDLRGHIICPQQVNRILKNGNTNDKLSFFENFEMTFVITGGTSEEKPEQPANIYVKLGDNENGCIMKILFSSNEFCLGVIEKRPDKEMSDCLKLIPADMRNWKKMVISQDSVQVFT